MNRYLLKGRARQVIAGSKPSIITVALLYIVLITLVNSYTMYSTGFNHITDSECVKYITQGNYDYARIYLENHLNTSPVNAGVRLVLTVVCNIVSYGFVSFLIKSVRKIPAELGDLMNGFPMVLRIIVLELLEALFVTMWSVLLIVPGIIAAYSYRQAMYLLIDNPDMTPMQCIRESKRMMQGHKMELFTLDLSFIGWAILSVFGFIGMMSQVWSIPYMETTYVLYYEYLLAQTQARDRWASAENAY